MQIRSVSLVLIVLIVLIALVGLSSQAVSQPRAEGASAGHRGVWLGILGGGNLITYTTDIYPIQRSIPCLEVENGKGMDGWAGISCEYFLSSGGPNQNSLAFQLIYDSRSARFDIRSECPTVAQSVKNGVEADSSLVGDQSANLKYLSFNLFFKHNFWSGESPVGLGLMIGPSIGYQPQPTLTKDITSVGSSGNAANPVAITYYDTTVNAPDANKFRLAIRGAVTCDIPVTRLINAEVMAGYDWPLTKVDRYSNWSTSALFAGISVRYYIRN